MEGSPRIPRRARRVWFSGLCGLWLALAAASCGRGSAPAGRVVPVEQQDLVLDVVVTGTLKSLEYETVGPPGAVTSQWRFKIIRMAPEGTRVKEGDEVIAFDASELEKRLKDFESDASRVSEELSKTRAEDSLNVLTDRQTLEEAEAKRRKAELKADKPADLTQGREQAVYTIDRNLARREVEFEHERERAKRRQEESDIAVQKARLQRAQSRVDGIKVELAAMVVKARRAGTVIYQENWRGEKSKVGDDVWRASTPLEIASLSRMAAQGQVDEVDASNVAVGQRVGLRLEAHPDREYVGVVEHVANLVQTESPESRIKVVQIDIKLRETDPLLMRPGMRFRGRIEIARIPGVVQIPLAAVQSTASGPVVTKAGGTSGPTRVQLGRRSRESIEVLKGLTLGDRVLIRASESSEPAAGQKSGALGVGSS